MVSKKVKDKMADRRKCEECLKNWTCTPNHSKCTWCYSVNKHERDMKERQNMAGHDLSGDTPSKGAHVYKVMEDQVQILVSHQAQLIKDIEDGAIETKVVSRMLSDSSKALASLGREILNFEKAKLGDIKEMSQSDWIEAICSWFHGLPRSQAESMIDRLHEIHWNTRSPARKEAEARMDSTATGVATLTPGGQKIN